MDLLVYLACLVSMVKMEREDPVGPLVSLDHLVSPELEEKWESVDHQEDSESRA